FSSAQKSADGLGSDDGYIYQPLTEFGQKEKLDKEKEVIGFYLSAHPLDAYKKQLKSFNIQTFAQILARQHSNNSGTELMVIGCGLIKGKREIITKKGDRMAFVQLEDGTSNQAEIILFPKSFKKAEGYLETHQVFIVKGGLDITSQQKCKIKADEFVPIELFFEQWPHIEKVSLNLPGTIEETLLQDIKTALLRGKIPLELIFHENGKKLQLVCTNSVSLDANTIQTLEKQNVGVTVQL
ncbi:MAG: hypothetical protein P4L31_07120, partial [Candidatus Babeliales bacterium]|nr:hypothetical protein [Candidatus Babeliales bacterium]